MNMKRASFYRITALIAAILIFCLSLTSCVKKSVLNSEQEKSLIDAAEAFFESGKEYDAVHAVTPDDAAMLIYCFYNDKLEADSSGFGSIDKGTATELLKSAFNIPLIPHLHDKNAKELIYLRNNTYYIKVSRHAAAECIINGINADKNGGYESQITCKGENGNTAALTIKFAVKDGNVCVYECKRLDIA